MTQTLGSDWRAAKAGNKKEPVASTLHGIQWHRIILDVSLASPNPKVLCLILVLISLPDSESAKEWSSMRGRMINAAALLGCHLHSSGAGAGEPHNQGRRRQPGAGVLLTAVGQEVGQNNILVGCHSSC